MVAAQHVYPGYTSSEYAKHGRTVQTQLRWCRPAAVARQNRIAIWSCTVQGCAHAEQPVITSSSVGDSVATACAPVVAVPLPR